MFRCLIIEDDYAFALEVKFMVEKFGYQVVSIEKERHRLEEILKSTAIDLILSDVKLGSNSYSFDYLRDILNLPPIIFFSSYDEDELFEKSMLLNPVVYLKKPIDEVTLRSSMNNAIRMANVKPSKYKEVSGRKDMVFIKYKGEMISINTSEIIYIKSEGNHCEIIMTTNKYVVRSSIRNMIAILNDNSLLQVHRAYLININRITSYSLGKDLLVLDKAIDIPLGRTYKKNLKSAINNLKVDAKI